jgi:hypothetical protein
MQSKERAQFREIVTGACAHVLPKCGLPIDVHPQDVTEVNPRVEQLAAFIGFSGEPLRGAVTLLAPTELVRVSYPLRLKEGLQGSLDLFDWSGEIVNRLLGRIKADLAARGVEIEPSTPKAMMGEQLQFSLAQRSAVCALEFGCANHSVIILVDAVSTTGVILLDEQVKQSGVPEEGELLLF